MSGEKLAPDAPREVTLDLLVPITLDRTAAQGPLTALVFRRPSLAATRAIMKAGAGADINGVGGLDKVAEMILQLGRPADAPATPLTKKQIDSMDMEDVTRCGEACEVFFPKEPEKTER